MKASGTLISRRTVLTAAIASAIVGQLGWIRIPPADAAVQPAEAPQPAPADTTGDRRFLVGLL
ncbi:hypothetical protein [uncultured Leifsonia sp.]|uniref:hypothetical protein n=1 Tax=uncultured Leifsonia sp. TaxID=340359 RepID=UPI0025FB17CD|nr:hypothetical protein [uncultured Leifsonia sp.]